MKIHTGAFMKSNNNFHFFALGMIILGAFFLGMFFYTGLYASDDSRYLGLLREARFGVAAVPELAVARWLISLPILAYGQLFGIGAFWVASLHTIQYLGLIIVAAYLTRLMASDWASVAAGVLVASCPLVLIYSGAILPDNLLTLLIVSGLIFAIKSHEARSHREALTWAVLVGSAVGLSFTVKEPSIIFTAFAPLLCVVSFVKSRMDGVRIAIAIGAGFLLVLAIDMVICTWLFGDPIVRLRLGSVPSVLESARTAMEKQGRLPIARIDKAARAVSLIWHGIGYIFVPLAILSPLFLIIRPWRSFPIAALALTACATVAYHVLGSLSIREYVGIWIQARYLTVGAVLLLILVVVLADRAIRMASVQLPAAKPILGVLAAAAVLAFAGWSIAGAERWAGQIYRAPMVQEVLAFAERPRPDDLPVYAYGRVVGIVQLAALEGIARLPPIEHAGDRFIVLMDRHVGDPFLKGLLTPADWTAREMTAAEHGVLVWNSRRAALLAALGWPDTSMLVPPRKLSIYLVERRGDRSVGDLANPS